MSTIKSFPVVIILAMALLFVSCCHPQAESSLIDDVLSIQVPLPSGYEEVVLAVSDPPDQALDAQQRVWDCPSGNSYSRVSIRVEEYASGFAARRRYRAWLRSARKGCKSLPDITRILDCSADRIRFSSCLPGADAYSVAATYSRLFVLIRFENSGMTDDQATALANLILARIDEVLVSNAD